MVLIVVGLAILALGVHYRRAHRVPAGSQPVEGRIVDVEMKRSSLSNGRRLYGATVSYLHPRTGEPQVVRPDNYRPEPVEVGDAVTLMHDPISGVVTRPLGSPMAQMALPFVFGLGTIALGVVDLMG